MRLQTKANTFTARYPNGKENVFLKGTTLFEIMEYERLPDMDRILLAKVNNQVRHIRFPVEEDSLIEWLSLDTPETGRANQHTLCLVLIRAVGDLFPSNRLLIDHSLGNGLYCEMKHGVRISRLRLKKLQKRMLELIRKDDPVEIIRLPREKALDQLEQNGENRALVAGNEDEPILTLYQFGDTIDYFGYPLFYHTRLLSDFHMEPWLSGFILRIPEDPERHPAANIKQKKLFQVFHEYGHWEHILGIEKTADLNIAVQSRKIFDLIKIAEGLHEKKIANIADLINRKRKQLRLILIAGPSSSGKTTFTKRLSIQLRVNGLRPLAISLDDYFLDRNLTPKDARGQYQYESLEALDVARFNKDISQLMAGRQVRLPRYDFKAGKCMEGPLRKVEKGHPILIEGLHGINESLSYTIPSKNKLKLYVSALTQLNMTDHLRIPTSDIRVLRRMIRDFQFRGYSAADTLNRWTDVRRGEEINIFPLQEQTDLIFNSALSYEPAVLRTMAKPLLESVSPDDPSYPEARRLLEMLLWFLPVSHDHVPFNSVLREFVGGSSFQYE